MTIIDERRLEYQRAIADAVLRSDVSEEAVLGVLEVPVRITHSHVGAAKLNNLVALVIRFSSAVVAEMIWREASSKHDPETSPLPFELHGKHWIGWPMIRLASADQPDSGYTREYFGRWINAQAVTWSDAALAALKEALDQGRKYAGVVSWTTLTTSTALQQTDQAQQIAALRRELAELKRRTTTYGTLLLLDALLD